MGTMYHITSFQVSENVKSNFLKSILASTLQRHRTNRAHFIDYVSFQTYIWNIYKGKSINWGQGEDDGKISVHISGPTRRHDNEVSLVLRQEVNRPE